jgi:hypothetical protein
MVSRQLNLRFDEQHHDVVRQVVDRLRRDSTFLTSLEALLASDSAPANDQPVPETLARIERLEQRMNALEPRVDILETARPAPQPRPARASTSTPSVSARASAITPSAHTDDAGAASAEAGAWTTGGMSPRLTAEGRAEVVRRIQAGGGDTEIARAIGVHRETVRRIRKDLPGVSVT